MRSTTNEPKAFSYVRFSTPEQERGDSFRRQSAAAKAWADERRIPLDESSYQDFGVSAFSGTNATTGMLGTFREAVNSGDVPCGSYLLIESLDRLSRNKARKAVRLLEDICEDGITVVTLSDGKEYTDELFDEDPMAFMWALMVAMRAHEESAMKSARVRQAWASKKQKAQAEGKPMTRRVPAWLELSEDRSEIVVREDRAAIIQRIFEDAVAGKGQHAIAEALNEEGVPTFGDGKRRAQYWQRSYVAKILGNPAAFGVMTPHEVRVEDGKKGRKALEPIPNFYPAVVSKATFDRVNQRASMPRMNSKKGEVSNVLAALAKCPKCGGSMTRVNKGKNNGVPYLICSRAKSGGGCEYRSVKLPTIEEAIRGAGETIRNTVPAPDSGLEECRIDLNSREEGVRTSIEHVLEAIEQGHASALLRERLGKLEDERATIEGEQRELAAKIDRSGGKGIELRVNRLADLLLTKEATITEINAGLRELFERCVVEYEDDHLSLQWAHGGEPTRIAYVDARTWN